MKFQKKQFAEIFSAEFGYTKKDAGCIYDDLTTFFAKHIFAEGNGILFRKCCMIAPKIMPPRSYHTFFGESGVTPYRAQYKLTLNSEVKNAVNALTKIDGDNLETVFNNSKRG